MCGGDAEDVAKVQPAFDALKPEGDFGFVHAGAVGAGHFAKMVHNGIEYAIMQAYAEGWELLEKVDVVDNVTEVFRSWREGTVIRSWLLDLLVAALDEDPGLDEIRGYAEDSGEGRWTVEAGIDNAVPMPAITAALFARFVSRQDDSPAMKAIAAMRNQFGGHAVQTGTPGGDRLRRPGRGQPHRRLHERPRERRGVHVAHLTLHDFRSYADVEVALEPGVTAFIGRNGQGKTNLVEAIDYLSRLGLAPGRDRRAAGPGRRRAGARAGRGGARRAHARARGRDQPGPVQPGPGQPVAAPAGPRPARPGAHGGLLARGPDLVKGDPSDRRRFLDDLLVLRTPRLAGVRADYDRVLKQRNSPAQDGRRRAPRQRSSQEAALATLGSGTPTSPAPAPSCSPRGSRWSPSCARTSARPTRRSPAARRRDDAEIEYKPSFDVAGCDRPDAELTERAPRRARARGATTSSTAASRWSARTATTCC